VKTVKFTFLFNVRINSQERYFRLIETLNSIPEILDSNFSIRVRGNLKDLNFQSVHSCQFYFGSSWNEWNLDLIEQVAASPSEYYILMQEDHLLEMSKNNFNSLLREVKELSIDYLPLSFHPHYEVFTKELFRKCPSNEIKEKVTFWDLDKHSYSRTNFQNRNYLLNLIGIYKKDLLLRLLLRSRPYYKQFSIQTPFNFERRPNETWFLPIRWAYPHNEVFACIDDDHGLEGYSLISRGKYKSQSTRLIEHHDVYSRNSSINFDRFKKIFASKLSKKIQVLPRNLTYSIEFVFNCRKRRKVVRKLLTNPNS
jgi:hypothetical protein